MDTCCATCNDPAVAAALAALPPIPSPDCGTRKGFPDTCMDPLAMARTDVLIASHGNPPAPTCCPCPPDDVQ